MRSRESLEQGDLRTERFCHLVLTLSQPAGVEIAFQVQASKGWWFPKSTALVLAN